METDNEKGTYTIRAVDDPIGGAVMPLVEAIFAVTRDGSPERAAALGELMLAVDRIRTALRPKPSFH
jgi:hypothetical protein